MTKNKVIIFFFILNICLCALLVREHNLKLVSMNEVFNAEREGYFRGYNSREVVTVRDIGLDWTNIFEQDSCKLYVKPMCEIKQLEVANNYSGGWIIYNERGTPTVRFEFSLPEGSTTNIGNFHIEVGLDSEIE